MTFKILRAMALIPIAVLEGCPAGPQVPAAPPGAAVAHGPAALSPPPLHEGQPYDVVSRESLLRILAFRGGPLAKTGHNHVIASHDVTGTFYVPTDPLRTTFELHIPVAQLSIDEPELRALEGAEFVGDVPDSAKEGTRHNMLSAALLDGESFPEITVMSQRIEADTQASSVRADVQVVVRGTPHLLKVPLRYELGNGRLTASGELQVKHSELGLTPFSALLGALQVQDELQVKFHLVAQAAGIRRPGS